MKQSVEQTQNVGPLETTDLSTQAINNVRRIGQFLRD